MSRENGSPQHGPLHERHEAAGAEMGVEDGWAVPSSFGDVAAEYEQVRSRAGVFDLSSVGRIRLRGDEALDLLDHLCTADVLRQEDDTALFTLLCNERGGIIDGVLLVRMEGQWLLTCSPSRRQAVLDHLQAHADRFGASVDDQTHKTSLLAGAGPGAPAIFDAVLPERASALPRGAVKVGSMVLARYLAIRAGCIASWDLEVVVPNMIAGLAWDYITRKAGANVIPPVGLTVHEVLRVEAGLVRHGREIDETTDPVTAGLGGAVAFGKDFLGAEAIRAIRDRGPDRRRVGLIFPDEGEPKLSRETVRAWAAADGAAVLDADERKIGQVTSAALSPRMGAPIAMAYVAAEQADGGEVVVELAEGRRPARVVALPFRPPGG